MKVYLEPNLARDVRNNKKYFYWYIGLDKEKAELLNNLFVLVFTVNFLFESLVDINLKAGTGRRSSS